MQTVVNVVNRVLHRGLSLLLSLWIMHTVVNLRQTAVNVSPPAL
jgi:hypothetical protein